MYWSQFWRLSQCKQGWRYNKPRELRENPGYFSIDELIRLLKDRNILELSGITKANIEGSYKCMANLKMNRTVN